MVKLFGQELRAFREGLWLKSRRAVSQVLTKGGELLPRGAKRSAFFLQAFSCFLLMLSSPVTALPKPPKEPKSGAPVSVEIQASEADVLKAVQEVVDDQIIHGTYSYERERTLKGAHPASSSGAFEAWKGPGTVLYKVADNILSPRDFRESADIGTITVRYVVVPTDSERTHLDIEAVFVETTRRTVHPSMGAVETAEYAAFTEHLEALQMERKAAAEDQARIEKERAARQAQAEKAAREAGASASATSSLQELEKRVEVLRRQVESKVKTSDTPLKSAPYRSAATVQLLKRDTPVVILILTPYWYGVETADGHRGWIHRDQLEPVQ